MVILYVADEKKKTKEIKTALTCANFADQTLNKKMFMNKEAV